MMKDEEQTNLQAANFYHIVVAGLLEEAEFNAASPLWITLERCDLVSTQFCVSTDQSGLIGLLRFLHQRGFVLLSVSRSETNQV